MRNTFSFLGLLCLILVYSCNKQNRIPSIRTLPIDSSLAIIMETTGLLTDSCVPLYWPRDFSIKAKADRYIAYIQQDLYQRDTVNRKHFKASSKYFPKVDSSFYTLIDDATGNYAIMTNGEKITIKDIRPLSNKLIKFGLINGQKEMLNDNELGYLKVSPVFIKGEQGIFFYQLNGEFMSSWLVCIRKTANKWVIISKSRLAVS